MIDGYISDVQPLKTDVLKREDIGETGIGNMIAIPHGKSTSVKKSAISICKLDREIKWKHRWKRCKSNYTVWCSR